jgi:hypothetical protein
MPPLDYLLLRFIRRRLPDWVMRAVLNRRLGIRPGLETRDPEAAVARYQSMLEAKGRTIADRTILVLGYGGSFGVAVELLRRGARHVVLCDPYASPDSRVNLAWLNKEEPYLRREASEITTNPEWITLVHTRIMDYELRGGRKVDFVLSSSVYEHLLSPDKETQALARLTAAGGFQLHLIDLRDHFFKYPFEMLCYSGEIWRRWLNPTSNLNRFRIWDYKTTFRRYFQKVECEVISSDMAAFRKIKPRIKSEFLSGDESRDAITRIGVYVERPYLTERVVLQGLS